MSTILGAFAVEPRTLCIHRAEYLIIPSITLRLLAESPVLFSMLNAGCIAGYGPLRGPTANGTLGAVCTSGANSPPVYDKINYMTNEVHPEIFHADLLERKSCTGGRRIQLKGRIFISHSADRAYQ
jgi:hypothetical protein